MKRKLLSLIPCFIGISLMAQVGVNTEPDPDAMLKVKGNMAITTVNKVSREEAEPLVWDASTGKVMTGEIRGKLMYFLDYTIVCNSSDGIYSFKNGLINDFNTRISSDRFKIMISNIYPVNNNGGVVDIRHVANSEGKDWKDYDVEPQVMRWYQGVPNWYAYGDKAHFKPDLNPVLKAETKNEGGYWHLRVGYLNARPDGSYGSDPNVFKWNIRIIAIDRSLLKEIPQVSAGISYDGNPGANSTNPIN